MSAAAMLRVAEGAEAGRRVAWARYYEMKRRAEAAEDECLTAQMDLANACWHLDSCGQALRLMPTAVLDDVLDVLYLVHDGDVTPECHIRATMDPR